jgi:hypothetical protein
MTAPVDLRALAGRLLEEAAAHSSGRAAQTLPHPVDGLRQTLIALRGGAALDEHESPGAASLLVVLGRVRIEAGPDSVDVGRHEIVPIPDRRHGLTASEDAAVLLSVAVPARSPETPGDGNARGRDAGG